MQGSPHQSPQPSRTPCPASRLLWPPVRGEAPGQELLQKLLLLGPEGGEPGWQGQQSLGMRRATPATLLPLETTGGLGAGPWDHREVPT